MHYIYIMNRASAAAALGFVEALRKRKRKREAGPVESLGVSVCMRTRGGNKNEALQPRSLRKRSAEFQGGFSAKGPSLNFQVSIPTFIFADGIDPTMADEQLNWVDSEFHTSTRSILSSPGPCIWSAESPRASSQNCLTRR